MALIQRLYDKASRFWRSEAPPYHKDAKPSKKSLTHVFQKLHDTHYIKDFNKWVEAKQTALRVTHPRRKLLIRIYDDVVLDGHIKGVINKRIHNITNKKFKIVDAKGKENKELTKLLRKKWFREYRRYVIESVFFGYSLFEFFETRAGEIHACKLLERKNVVPEFREFLRIDSDGRGVLIDDYPDAMFVTNDNLGLLLGLSVNWIFKKSAMAAWSQFGEIFGMPLRTVRTNTADDKQRRTIEEAMQNMGPAAYAILPHGTEIEITASSQSDAHAVFMEQINLANAEISKAVLGQTMTTDSGSSLSQSEVHEREQDDVFSDDAEFVGDEINDNLLPYLSQKNEYDFEGYQFVWDDTEQLNKKERWAIMSGVLQNYEVLQQDRKLAKQIRDEYNVNINIPSLSKSKEPSTQEQNKTEETNEETDEADRQRFQPTAALNLTEIFFSIARKFWSKKLKSGVKVLSDKDVHKLHKLTTTKLQLAVTSGMGEQTSQAVDNVLEARLKNSVALFSTFKSFKYLGKVGDLVSKHDNYQDFRNEAVSVLKTYNERHLKTEYDTALSRAQMAQFFSDAQKTKDAFPYLEWVTVGDDAVRPSHKALHGIIKPVDEWTDVPPIDFNCRCRLKRTKKKGNSAKSLPLQKGVKGNPYKSGAIFSGDHEYFNVPNETKKKLQIENNRIIYDSYGEDYQKAYFDKNSGGFVVVHKNHNANHSEKIKKEITEKELRNAKKLAEIGKKVELAADSLNDGAKLNDALINGVSWELKNITGNYKSLSNSINKGKKQSDGRVSVLVDKTVPFDEDELKRGIGRIRNHDKSNSIKEYYIFNGKTVKHYKNEK